MADLTPAAFLAGLCGLGILVLLALSIWSKRENPRAAAQGYRSNSDAAFLSGPLRAETFQLLADGRKIEAIKRVREATGWDLKRAKDAVEHIQRGRAAGSIGTDPRFGGRSDSRPELDDEIRELLSRRRRIEAVKLVKDRTGWGLKESKEYVERIGFVRLDDY